MAAVEIVGVQEVVVGGYSFGLAGIGAGVSPFLGKDPVEAFDAPMFVKRLLGLPWRVIVGGLSWPRQSHVSAGHQ